MGLYSYLSINYKKMSNITESISTVFGSSVNVTTTKDQYMGIGGGFHALKINSGQTSRFFFPIISFFEFIILKG